MSKKVPSIFFFFHTEKGKCGLFFFLSNGVRLERIKADGEKERGKRKRLLLLLFLDHHRNRPEESHHQPFGSLGWGIHQIDRKIVIHVDTNTAEKKDFSALLVKVGEFRFLRRWAWEIDKRNRIFPFSSSFLPPFSLPRRRRRREERIATRIRNAKSGGEESEKRGVGPDPKGRRNRRRISFFLSGMIFLFSSSCGHWGVVVVTWHIFPYPYKRRRRQW